MDDNRILKMTKEEANKLIEYQTKFLYNSTDCSSGGAHQFMNNLKTLVKYWAIEEKSDETIPIKWLIAQAENPSNSDEIRNAIDHIVYKLWPEREKE